MIIGPRYNELSPHLVGGWVGGGGGGGGGGMALRGLLVEGE